MEGKQPVKLRSNTQHLGFNNHGYVSCRQSGNEGSSCEKYLTSDVSFVFHSVNSQLPNYFATG